MCRKKICFIINPISGAIKKQDVPQTIERILSKTEHSYEIAFTQQAGHAFYLAQEAVQNGYDIVVAVGGDGSINEVAKALINTKVALGIIPLGSGNGLAYHLALPVKDVEKALQVILSGKTIKIDTLSSNKGSIISFCGIGIEAVAARVYRHLGVRGFLAYAWATILSVFVKYKEEWVHFQIDNNEFNEKIYLFTVYNARYLGYKMGEVKQASLHDGFMDIVVVKAFPKWKLLWIALLEVIGKIHWAKEASIHKAKKLHIALNKKSPIQLDGDSSITSSHFEIQVNPLSLNVIVPQTLENY
ncbi:MAG: diacylglycerol kinase family lipid kinase [Chitinophagales bacterium]|nr:diacylglycerol kinase family lipid kinase [Chitinophagales bacterium]